MMKLRYMSLLICLALISFSQKDSFGQETYHSGTKHVQPDLTVFPSANYYLDVLITGGLKDHLDKTVNELFNLTGMPGLSVAMLVPEKGFWQRDTGYVNQPDKIKVNSNIVFYWASVTKLLTATIIQQLIREEKLGSDSKLSAWFPQFQNAKYITIDQLLEHTSGIYNFNNDPKIFNIDRYYSPDELINLASAQKNGFKPGQYWSYSNTNYLLLALIAEKIEGKSFANIIQERIARPLQLHSLRVLEAGEHPAELALAHANGKIVSEDYSVPLGAGDIVSNASDMVKLLYSLMTGKLGPVADIHDRLKDLYPMSDKGMYYGRGIMVSDFKELTGTNDLWIGHSGGTETYRALLVYDTATQTFIALAINQHISAEACAMKLLEKVKL